jgi:hypothetical protein
MAIGAVEYWLISQLAHAGALPPAPHVLELGENNWYGDVPIEQLGQDVYRQITDPAARQRSFVELNGIVEAQTPTMLFDVAKVFYRTFLGPASLSSIDLSGTAAAHKVDLNCPIQASRQFDVVINFGTANHVFNLPQFFKTVHDVTAPGGLMLHGMPLTGRVDDGFYNVQPTFYWDLAAANGYEIVLLVYGEPAPFKVRQLESRDDVTTMAQLGEIGATASVYAVFRHRAAPGEFAVPIQGRYLAELAAGAAA